MWEYNQPNFEFSEAIPLNYNSAPWGGHSFFAYDLVINTKPSLIVELGTYKGNSLFSMAQAVKDMGLDTTLYAIDTWEGDEHSGWYEGDILDTFDRVRNNFYRDIDIVPCKMTFDEALGDFEDGSIDILHIDGLHTYEAVKHDFENWLPKVKKGGVIMFHDIRETRDDFGVYKLWEELEKKYKTIAFDFYHGLGVVFLGDMPKIDVTPYYVLAGGLG